jgi:hypothetical protein
MTAMTHTITTRRIARAEWTKLRTLPSTWRTAVITVWPWPSVSGSLWPTPR